MFKLLKWIGIAAVVAVPLLLIVKTVRGWEAESVAEDEFDIYMDEE